MPGDTTIVFVDKTEGQVRYEFEKEELTFPDFCQKLGVSNERTVYHPAVQGYKDWNDQLLEKPIEQVVQEKQQMLASRINTESSEKSDGKEQEKKEVTEESAQEEERRPFRLGR